MKTGGPLIPNGFSTSFSWQILREALGLSGDGRRRAGRTPTTRKAGRYGTDPSCPPPFRARDPPDCRLGILPLLPQRRPLLTTSGRPRHMIRIKETHG